MTKNQSNGSRVALITGANKGLGLEIARQLGRQGVTVVVGARDGRRGQEAAAACAVRALTRASCGST